MIVGNPKKIKQKLEELSELYQTDEIMLVSITYDFQDKLKSYALIADEMLWLVLNRFCDKILKGPM